MDMQKNNDNDFQTDLEGDELILLGEGSKNNNMVPVSAKGVPVVPMSLLRPAIFTAKQARFINSVMRKPVACSKNMSIFFTGRELIQSDLSVWETILYLVKDSPIGDWFTFTANQLLTEMKITPAASTYQALYDSLDRLSDCRINIVYPSGEFKGGLMTNAFFSKDRRKFAVKLDEEIYSLYHIGDNNDWVFIDMNITRQLARKPLALYLYHYFVTHIEPFELPLSWYKERTENLHVSDKEFKRKMTQALKSIRDTRFISEFEIDPVTTKLKIERSNWISKV